MMRKISFIKKKEKGCFSNKRKNIFNDIVIKRAGGEPNKNLKLINNENYFFRS